MGELCGSDGLSGLDAQLFSVRKEFMKRTKRLAIEVWHREVVITIGGSPVYRHEVVPPHAAIPEAVCGVCGSPWISVSVTGTEEALSGAENIHRALEEAGVHLQVSATGQLNICRKSLEDLKEK